MPVTGSGRIWRAVPARPQGPRAGGVLLGGDDVGRAGGVDGEAFSVDDGLAGGQLLVEHEASIGGKESGQHGAVELYRQGRGW